jgi:hypothetical protein
MFLLQDLDCSEASGKIFQPFDAVQCMEESEVSKDILLLASFDIFVADTPDIKIIVENIKKAHMEAYYALVEISENDDNYMEGVDILDLLKKLMAEPELQYAYIMLKQACDNTFNALLVRLVEDYLKDGYLLEVS